MAAISLIPVHLMSKTWYLMALLCISLMTRLDFLPLYVCCTLACPILYCDGVFCLLLYCLCFFNLFRYFFSYDLQVFIFLHHTIFYHTKTLPFCKGLCYKSVKLFYHIQMVGCLEPCNARWSTKTLCLAHRHGESFWLTKRN